MTRCWLIGRHRKKQFLNRVCHIISHPVPERPEACLPLPLTSTMNIRSFLLRREGAHVTLASCAVSAALGRHRPERKLVFNGTAPWVREALSGGHHTCAEANRPGGGVKQGADTEDPGKRGRARVRAACSVADVHTGSLAAPQTSATVVAQASPQLPRKRARQPLPPCRPMEDPAGGHHCALTMGPGHRDCAPD